jgi:putative membrane protein
MTSDTTRVSEPPIDYRFSLANERTYLAWIRTSFALLAGGIAAAKALNWHHEIWRWVIAVPPIVASLLLALHALHQQRAYADAMERGAALPTSRWPRALAIGIAIYALVALLAAVLDS